MDPSTDDVSFPDFVDAPPDAERATLHGLSPSAFREKALSLARKHQNIALAYLSIHNAAAPIFALPTEILSMILALCWTTRASLRVAHVCRRWRAVALKTPDLWADAVGSEHFYFDISHSPPGDSDINRLAYIEVMAGRSAPKRLRFHATFTPILSKLLQSHTSRLISLDVRIYSGYSYREFFLVLVSGMNALEDLNVWFCDRSWSDESISEDHSDEGPWYEDWGSWDETDPLQAPRFSLPNLKTVCAPGLMFFNLACETLQTVTLKNTNCDSSEDLTRIPSPHQLYQGLKRCPNLRSLKFIDALPEETGITPQLHHPVKLELPHLETLFITDFDCDTQVAAILSTLSLPTLASLSVTGTTGLHFTQHSLLEDKTVLHKLLQATDSVQINDCGPLYGTFEVSLSATQHNVHRLLVRYPHSLSNAEAHIAVFRPCTSITHLSFEIWQGQSISDEQTLFRAFPHLLSLHITGAQSVRLLAALQEPDDPHNSQSLVAPSLRTLNITFQFKNGGDVSTALNGAEGEAGVPQAVLKDHMLARSALLLHTLQHRASRGSRLVTLTWSEFEEKSWNLSRRYTLGNLSDSGLNTVEFGLAALRSVVDGQVTFEAFGFFTARSYLTGGFKFD